MDLLCHIPIARINVGNVPLLRTLDMLNLQNSSILCCKNTVLPTSNLTSIQPTSRHDSDIDCSAVKQGKLLQDILKMFYCKNIEFDNTLQKHQHKHNT